MRYGVVFEDANDGGVGAYVADIPGVGVVGENRLEALQMLRQAVRWQVEALIEDAAPIPLPAEGNFDAYIDLESNFIVSADDRLRDQIVLLDREAAPQVFVEQRVQHVAVLQVAPPVPA